MAVHDHPSEITYSKKAALMWFLAAQENVISDRLSSMTRLKRDAYD
jgi:hypothetical protein